MNKVEGFKAEANNLVAAKHTEAGQYVETTRMNTLQQIEQQQLITCDASICATHLKALLEAEVVELYALGVLREVDEQLFTSVVERAITVFLRAYQR